MSLTNIDKNWTEPKNDHAVCFICGRKLKKQVFFKGGLGNKTKSFYGYSNSFVCEKHKKHQLLNQYYYIYNVR